MPSILIIDDDRSITKMLVHYFTSKGWAAAGAERGEEGRELADKCSPDVILLDVKLPDMDGIEVLKKLKAQGSAAAIVIMTGGGSIPNAVEAIKLGAEHYLTKPLEFVELDRLIDRILETKKLRMENLYYRHRMEHPIAGNSLEVQKLHHLIDLMAENADTTTLLLGESGTGKELVAREIHRRSARSERPFLDINCAVLSETLLESEIFGHERGAFTDARELKQGLLEVADGGTVLLDEIGEMPFAVQPKLLRVLETRSFRRVGGTRDIPVNVRIIAATNRNLEKAMAEGRFREDLYYRLHVFPIKLPPLRQRPVDIPVLTAYFLDLFNATLKKTMTGFTPRAMELMGRYSWPGNVRELKNIVERAMVLSKSAVIDIDMLPREIVGLQYGGGEPVHEPQANNSHKKTLDDLEREHILDVLRAEGNNRTAASKVLGISRSTLQDKLKKYGVT
jgi:two-component system, NtrC family, response regulator AtoC